MALSRVWPGREDEGKAILAALTEDTVFADPVTPLAYFLDVLVWNDEAKIRSRSRAAFLRLYGAVESVFFYAFEAYAGRPPGLTVVPVKPDDLEQLKARFPTDRHGTSIDWLAELRKAAVGYFRISSLGALRVLARSSGQLEPQVDLGKLLGDQATEARQWIPKVRAWIEEPPISRGLHNRLVDSKKGGLGRFNQLRNKAAHWMAPVPPKLALELRRYYQRVLCELLPRTAERLQEGATAAERERLQRASHRLLEAAEDRLHADDQPVSYRRALEFLRRCEP